jgi:hypothetical protein
MGAGRALLVSGALMACLLPAAQAAAVRVPEPVRGPVESYDRCPTEGVEAWRTQIAANAGDSNQEALRQGFDRSVAEWAVCMDSAGFTGWWIPALDDAAARAIIVAIFSPQGSRERVEGVESARASLPQAAAVLALRELEILQLIDQGRPEERISMVMAALGAWGCPDNREWMRGPRSESLGWCPKGGSDDEIAAAALQNLYNLTRPSLDPQHWLTRASATDVLAAWTKAAQVWLPMSSSTDLHAVALPTVAEGTPIAPGVGWVLYLTPERTFWAQRAALRMAAGGVDITDVRPMESGSPPPTEGALVVVDQALTIGEVQRRLTTMGSAHPQLVAQGPRGLVDLGLRLRNESSDAPSLVVGPDPFDRGAIAAAAGSMQAAAVPTVSVNAATTYGNLADGAGALRTAAGRPVAMLVSGGP